MISVNIRNAYFHKISSIYGSMHNHQQDVQKVYKYSYFG